MNIKEELKKMGDVMGNDNPKHKESLRQRVQDNFRCETVRPKRWPRVLAPVFSVAVMALLVVVSSTYQPNYYSDTPIVIEDSRSYSGDMVASDTAMLSESAGLGAPTFKNSFLRGVGKNTATQKQIDEYRAVHGDMFEEDLSVSLLSKEKDSVQDVESIITGLGGYVDNVRESRYGTSTITGRIPKENVELLRDDLRDFVKKDKFYTERRQAQNRVADAIAIDEKVQEVEGAIVLLSEQLATEEDPERIKELNEELRQHYSYLKERQETRDLFIEQVEYVDISIAVSEIESWWSSDSYFELSQTITGYESPGFVERLLINVLFVLGALITIFTYTFWFVIPLVIWLIFRRRRKNLFAELE